MSASLATFNKPACDGTITATIRFLVESGNIHMFSTQANVFNLDSILLRETNSP